MMAILFNGSHAGKVVRGNIGVATGVSASFVPGGSCLLQSISTDYSVNLKATPSLSNNTYFYALGDNPGTVTVSGIALLRSCSGGNPYSALFGAYTGARATEVPASMMSVSYGGHSVSGFMVGCTHAVDLPELCAGHFSFRLCSTPDM